MFCRQVFGNISGGFRGISRFWGEFRGILWKYLNFTGPRPREISEALTSVMWAPCLKVLAVFLDPTIFVIYIKFYYTAVLITFVSIKIFFNVI